MTSPADLLIENARVLTCDPQRPRAEAVALRGNAIVFVGSNQQAKDWHQSGVRVIDAAGASLLPGFIDSHAHLRIGSAELENLLLDEVKDLPTLTAALQRYAREHPEKPWVLGSHLTYSLFPGEQRLTRHHLDTILPDRPLALMAYDYHTLWVNTRALELAGLFNTTDVVREGEVVRGADGLPSGELREMAAYLPVLSLTGAWGRANSSLLGQQADSFSPAELSEDRRLLENGLRHLAQVGVTSVHNMDGDYQAGKLYASLEQSATLTCRVYLPLSVTAETPVEALQEAVAMRQDFASDMLHAGFIKVFMDGVLESWTAYLLDDYPDRPGYRGQPIHPLEQFIRLVCAADGLGLQIAVHAIGDAAVRQTLDGYQAARQANGARDSRHRIEHIELIHPADVPRFPRLGVLASMQPLHLPGGLVPSGEMWLSHAGESRWQRGFAWQSLRQAGAQLVFGSDWPVVSPNPLLGLAVALNRQPWKPGLPDQRQTLEDALASYTRLAAWAEFQERRKGMLRAGMLADLVLLSADLTALPTEALSEAQVVMTVVDGRVVYQG